MKKPERNEKEKYIHREVSLSGLVIFIQPILSIVKVNKSVRNPTDRVQDKQTNE
jgi:hypothetical protein